MNLMYYCSPQDKNPQCLDPTTISCIWQHTCVQLFSSFASSCRPGTVNRIRLPRAKSQTDTDSNRIVRGLTIWLICTISMFSIPIMVNSLRSLSNNINEIYPVCFKMHFGLIIVGVIGFSLTRGKRHE